MIIYCSYVEDEKRIEYIRFKELFWIEIEQFYDIIYRGGWTIHERARAWIKKSESSESESSWLSHSSNFSPDNDNSEGWSWRGGSGGGGQRQ